MPDTHRSTPAFSSAPPVAAAEPKVGNATFHCFRQSGKWYTTERGVLPPEVFKPYLHHGDKTPARVNTWDRILAANGGKMPGLSTTGSTFNVIVILDEDVDHGYPIMLTPLEAD